MSSLRARRLRNVISVVRAFRLASRIGLSNVFDQTTITICRVNVILRCFVVKRIRVLVTRLI